MAAPTNFRFLISDFNFHIGGKNKMSFRRITLPDATAQGETEPRTINVTNVQTLDNRPQMTATELKTAFDAGNADIKKYLTGLVNEINGFIGSVENDGTNVGAVSGASNIGAERVLSEIESENRSAPNVQAQLTVLKNYINTRVLQSGGGDMMQGHFATIAADAHKVDHAVDADNFGGVLPSAYSKEIKGQTVKTTLADDDAFPIADSAADGVQKKTLWSTIKTALESAFAKKIDSQAAVTAVSLMADDDVFAMVDTSANAQKKVPLSILKGIFAQKIAVVSDSTSVAPAITAANNTEYRYGTLTSLTINGVPAENFSCRILCTAGNGFTINLPAGTKKAGGIAFVYNAGDKLQIYLDQDGATVVPFRAV